MSSLHPVLYLRNKTTGPAALLAVRPPSVQTGHYPLSRLSFRHSIKVEPPPAGLLMGYGYHTNGTIQDRYVRARNAQQQPLMYLLHHCAILLHLRGSDPGRGRVHHQSDCCTSSADEELVNCYVT